MSTSPAWAITSILLPPQRNGRTPTPPGIILDPSNVPYGLTAGNHDGAPSGTANFNTNFGVSRFTGKPWYGGHYGSDNDNHYSLFSASGLDFIVIFIEYDDSMTTTDHPVLDWANSLLQTNSDRRAIVVSHNMLSGNNFSTQGQTIYDALKANPNLFLMLGGHLDVAGQRSDTYLGNTVYTLRSDYQNVDSQQSGYLRIMRFSPSDDMIYVRTYSPTQNKDYDKSDAAQNNFNLRMRWMAPASRSSGRRTVWHPAAPPPSPGLGSTPLSNMNGS